MATYTQRDRVLSIIPPAPLGPDDLLIVGLHGQESISRLFSFHLDLVAPKGKTIALDAALQKKVTITIGLQGSPSRQINGICSRISQGARDEDFTSYSMTVVPEAWLLTRIARSRIFQHKTVPEILTEVFQGIAIDPKLTGTYQPRDYCVQYRETDFNFVSRLMEEEGIFYFFRHSANGHVMVLGDSPAAHPMLAGSFIYDEVAGGEREGTENVRVTSWEKAQELRSAKVQFRDYCFEKPTDHFQTEKAILDSIPVGKSTHKLKPPAGDRLELYDYPGEYAQRFDGINSGGGEQPAEIGKILPDGNRTTAIRMEQEAAHCLRIHGTGTVPAFEAGSKFTLERHFDADGTYLLAAVSHSARMDNSYRSGGGEFAYDCSFECLPSALPYRPDRLTAKPVIHGTQTAVVVGGSGDEIFPDKYGRVKVQFPWDRLGKHDQDSSCWIRVGTPWAGAKWGMIHIPRVGQEVIVAFEEGDPDRPIIVGSVYNADMMPPYELPANKTQSGIKTRSTLKGTPTNFNELRFEDKKGEEQVYFHAEKNFDRVVENNDTLKVGSADSQTCPDGSQTISVWHHRTETVETGDETVSIKKGNRTVNVNTGNDTHNVKTGDRTVNVDKGNDTHNVKTGDRTVNVNKGNDTHNIKMGNRAVLIEMGNDSLNIKMGNQTTKLDLGSSTTEAMQSITLKVGGSSIVIDQMGVTIKGMMVKVEGQVQTDIKGLMTSIQGEAMLTAKGGITMIN